MSQSLSQLVAATNTHEGSWKGVPLAQDVKMFLWEAYDPNDELIYPSIEDWAELLEKTISKNNYDALNKDEVLSILFGLIHRSRIVEGLWNSTFKHGISQQLLKRLLSMYG